MRRRFSFPGKESLSLLRLLDRGVEKSQYSFIGCFHEHFLKIVIFRFNFRENGRARAPISAFVQSNQPFPPDDELNGGKKRGTWRTQDCRHAYYSVAFSPSLLSPAVAAAIGASPPSLFYPCTVAWLRGGRDRAPKFPPTVSQKPFPFLPPLCENRR